MAASMLARLVGKAVSKTGKKESSEVAKKGTELMGRRDEKFMGMAEEVSPARLSGPAAKEAEKKGGRVGAAIAAGAGAAGAGAAMLSRDKSDKEEPTRAVSAGRVSEGKVTKEDDKPAKETSKAKESAKPSTFGAAFKEARSAGKDTFTYEGEKYTTEMAGEKKAAAKQTGVREGRNENIDDDTRKRAMESVANLNKGGMVVNKGIGASMKPHNVFGTKGKK